jgi:osmotically-inducible protein OsmY
LCVIVSLLFLTKCTPIAIVGGGAVVGGAVYRDKGVGESVTDTATFWKVRRVIYKISPDIEAQIGVNVQEGEVLLTGAVPSIEQKSEVEAAVWKVRNVKQVYNEIEISSVPPINNLAKDAAITTAVRSKLLARSDIKSVNYRVKTVNGVVYIFGVARTPNELSKVLETARFVKSARQVKSFIRLLDPR